MADDRRKRGQPDRNTINMKEIYEKKYWKKKFRVSGQALAGAVRAVGKSATRVEAYLKSKLGLKKKVARKSSATPAKKRRRKTAAVRA